jgi:hypothetical protein
LEIPFTGRLQSGKGMQETRNAKLVWPKKTGLSKKIVAKFFIKNFHFKTGVDNF